MKHRALVVVLAAGAMLAGALPAPAASAARSSGSSGCAVVKLQPSGAEGATAPTDVSSGAPVHFSDATEPLGAAAALTGMRGHAVAASDVNDDGWTDLFVGTFADRPVAEYRERGADGPAPDRLLLGGSDGFRVDGSFPGALGRTSGARFADLDGDGDVDLVVARQVRSTERGRAPTEILRNDGGTFTQAAVLDEPEGARSVGVLDVDGDGRLDLLVTEDRFAGGSSVVLRNEGDFRFTDVTDSSGFGQGVAGMGVGIGDLDGDGHADAFVGGANQLFLGDGEGGLRPVASDEFVWETFGDEDDPAGVALGDVDGDGRLDIVVGQHFNSTLDGGRRVPVRLYLNGGSEEGEPVFRDVTADAGLVGLPTKSPHVEIADLDADGRPDIVTTAAGTDGLPIVFRNTGVDAGVPRFAPTAEPGPAQYWVTGVVFDADRDGRLDLVQVEWEPSLPTRVYRNEGAPGRWVAVAAPTGSRVAAYPAGGAGDGPLLASVVVGASTGYGAGPPDVAWLGLGDARRVDVQVDLPGGATESVRRVRTDRWVRCSG